MTFIAMVISILNFFFLSLSLFLVLSVFIEFFFSLVNVLSYIFWVSLRRQTHIHIECAIFFYFILFLCINIFCMLSNVHRVLLCLCRFSSCFLFVYFFSVKLLSFLCTAGRISEYFGGARPYFLEFYESNHVFTRQTLCNF